MGKAHLVIDPTPGDSLSHSTTIVNLIWSASINCALTAILVIVSIAKIHLCSV
jgi:hypothetical protein